MAVGSDPRPGSVIAGFRLEQLLGRGGMGAVYLAEELRLGRKVAVKLLSPQLAENPRVRERFLRESQLAASLDHPHVIPIYAADEADGQLFLAMRYVPGDTLRDLLGKEGPLAPERALHLVGQVADALDAAHAGGLVHRDVKPANVLVAEQRGSEHCYLTDFGLTKQTSSISGLTETGELVGTLAYTAPEQIRGEQVDARADVYSLACVLHECLTGEQPFTRETEVATLWAHVNDPPPAASSARPELGRQVDAVLARGLAKKPEQRYASCGELVAAAATALSPAPAAAPFRLRRLSRRAIVAALAAATLAAGLAAGLTLVLTGSSGGTRVAAGSVAVVDPGTRRVVAAISVGFASPLIAAGEGSVWLADPKGDTLTRIDPKTNTVVAPTRGIPAEGIPVGLAAGAGSVWVAVKRAGARPAVLQLGPDLGELRHLIPLGQPGGGSLAREAVVLTIAQGAVWALERGLGDVWRIDPVTGKKKRLAEGLGASSSIAVKGTAIWLGGINGVTKLDARTGAELATTVVQQVLESTATSVAVADGAAWFAGDSYPRLLQISLRGNQVIDSFAVGAGPTEIAEGDGAVWVASQLANTLSRLDPATGEVEPVPLGAAPAGVVFAFGRLWTAP